MKQILLLVILFSVVSFWGCEGTTTDDEGTSAIEGLVVDSVSQLPIDSVALFLNDTIGNTNSYTDSLGAFQVPIWGSGVNKVFFRKQGYFTLSQIIDFRTNPKDLRIELVKQ